MWLDAATIFQEPLLVFNRLRRTLVARAPDLFRIPARLMPFALQQLVMERLLQRVFKEALADGDFEFLQDKWLKIEIRDLGLAWFISYQAHQLQIAPQAPRVDVTFAAALNDLVLIAGRKEDPDSLFFPRRLRIEGDTELGLELKNLLDGLDLDSLPGLVKLALADLATFVQDGLQPASAA